MLSVISPQQAAVPPIFNHCFKIFPASVYHLLPKTDATCFRFLLILWWQHLTFSIISVAVLNLCLIPLPKLGSESSNSIWTWFCVLGGLSWVRSGSCDHLMARGPGAGEFQAFSSLLHWGLGATCWAGPWLHVGFHCSGTYRTPASMAAGSSEGKSCKAPGGPGSRTHSLTSVLLKISHKAN